MSSKQSLCALIFSACAVIPLVGQQIAAPDPQPGTMSGTVTDVNDGKWEPNYSSVGGDLAAGAISNSYYPQSNRGAGILFENALITTGGRMANGLLQEFVLRRFTPSARNQTQ